MRNICLGCPVTGSVGLDKFSSFIANDDLGNDFLNENAKAKTKCIGIKIEVPG